MSNFQEKFNDWQEKMSKKSEKEKHNAALTIAFMITAIVFFFVASNWYFQISGNSYDSSLFTDIESSFSQQKQNFSNAYQSFGEQKKDFFKAFSDQQTLTATSTEPTTTVGN